MKRRIVFAFVFILLEIFVFPEESPQFRFEWTARNSAMSYETAYQANNICFNTAVMCGLELGLFTVGLEAFSDYVSLNGQDTSNLLKGSWMNFGGIFDIYVRPLSWIELKFGAGGLWQRSSFNYNSYGWLGLDQGGISATFDARFIPFTFLDFVITNRIDMILSSGDTGSFSAILPNYNGGAGINIYPGIRWLRIFIGGDVLYWNYSSEIRNIKSWMFEVQAGLTIDFRFPGKKENNTLQQIDIIKNISAQSEKAEEIDASLLQFSKLKPGSEISFTNIVFNKGEDTLTHESMGILDKLAKILVDNKTVVISVSSYAEYSGDVLKDYVLIKKRSETIQHYLSQKGVESNRIKINLSGQVIKINEVNTYKMRVLIKILSK